MVALLSVQRVVVDAIRVDTCGDQPVFGGANNGGRADDLNVVIGPVRVLGDDAPELTGEALVHSGRNV